MTPAPDIRVQYWKPAPALQRFVSGYHLYAVRPPGGGTHEDLFYPGWSNLRFQVEGKPWTAAVGKEPGATVPAAALFGPTSHAIRALTSGGALVGAGLTPLGWTRMTAHPAAEFANRIVPAGEVVGNAAERLHAELLAAVRRADEAALVAAFDSFFGGLMACPAPQEERIEPAQALLASAPDADVAEIAAMLGMSPRTFHRLAVRSFGFRPKLLLRRARFLQALSRLREAGGKSAALNLGEGYYDHSHFIRDAKEFLGMPPSAFLRLSKPMNDASTLLRTRALGAPMQALHQPPGGTTMPAVQESRPADRAGQ